MADCRRLFAGSGFGTVVSGGKLQIPSGRGNPAPVHGILQGSAGCSICGAFTDLVGSFPAGGGGLLFRGVSEYLSEHTGRLKKCGRRTDRDGRSVSSAVCHPFFYIYRPALKPFLLSAFQLSLGMSWKSGVAAEVIGTPLHSIGGALYLAKIYLDTADLFAWTAVIIVLSVLFEKIVFGCVEYFFRWEPACKRPAMPQKNVSRERRTLCVADFGKCYHDRWIFRHVEQEFHGGEPYFLDTPSGSGKTTFFRCLCGLERPEEGEVSGIDAFSVQFQEDRLCEEYSAVKNLEMVMGDAKEARKALTWLLPEEALGQPCHELSGGMKRRVSLVRAMEAGAQCVLLDEPFTGLDEENREKAYEYIRTHANGRIIMIATHIRPWENMPEDVQKGEGLWKRIRETQE